MHVRNPVEWGVDLFRQAGSAAERVGTARLWDEEARRGALPVRHIGIADLRAALAEGVEDFAAFRTDVGFLCVIYPLVGLVLARLAFGYDMLPLLFPLASGFALIGPFAAIGLYEMSRRRERGGAVSWADALGVAEAPNLAAILVLGAALVAVFLIWLGAAMAIYDATLGPEPPASVAGFVRDVLTTQAGWALIGIGIGVGFLFAAFVLAVSVVSFPILLDRPVGLETAIATSVRAVAENPRPMALWGLIVAAGLVLGSIPLLLGLIVVMPVLGHATWHLYRHLVPRG